MPQPWNQPPVLKIYEALGALADGRVRETGAGQAAVTSSVGNMQYTVTWAPATRTLSSNDNASFWQGYLGYPGLAYLMLKGELPCDAALAARLAGIEWKKINTKLKDHAKVIQFLAETKGIDLAAAEAFARQVLAALAARPIFRPAKRPSPP
jgi:hypothetical protein